MKGVVLAGGLGSRLHPLTKVTNKHLLPVYNEPMIYYPIKMLANTGIKEVLVVTGGNNAGDFVKLLENGKQFGLDQIHYAYQKGEGGIAAALSLSKDFADNEKIVVALGDNILEGNIVNVVKNFKVQEKGARVVLKKVSKPERFGVPVFEGSTIIRIEEKPANPTTAFAVIGVYCYDSRVFDFIKDLKPSQRGELEITDVNNFYIQEGLLEWDILEGWWSDAGTLNSLYRASTLVYRTGANKLTLKKEK